MSAGGPLAGITVVEIGRFITAPYAAMLLGDLGATVVKVEPVTGGDPFRQTGEPGISARFLAYNRNKQPLPVAPPRPPPLNGVPVPLRRPPPPPPLLLRVAVRVPGVARLVRPVEKVAPRPDRAVPAKGLFPPPPLPERRSPPPRFLRGWALRHLQ